MNLMGLFRSPQNELEKGGKQLKNPQEEQHEITMTCPKCGTQTPAQLIADTRKIRSRLNWRPKHDELRFIVRSALDWERHLLQPA